MSPLEVDVYALNVRNSRDQDLKDRVYERLMARSESDPETSCHVYLGAWTDKGNAKIRVGQRVFNLNRVAAWIFFETFELWGANIAFHKCETPACFNPSHLGVARDISEALREIHKLRKPRQPGRRLNKEKATQLRIRHFDDDATAHVLSAEFGLSKTSVRAVLDNKTWKDDDLYERRKRCA